MPDLPVAPFERIAKNAGATRVSEPAKEELRDTAEEYSLRIAAKAVKLAMHAGRKTIKARDVKLAASEL